MSENEFQVKEESKTTIQRGKHNKENPYVQISKKMLRDLSIGPREKGVLCYLLSMPDNWVTHPAQVGKSMGLSRFQIYDVLKKLIAAGYASKTEIKERGKFSKVSYCFYEEKIEPEEIKKNNTVYGIPYTENSYPVDQTHNKNILNTEDISIENISSLKVPIQESPTGDMPAKAGEKKVSFSEEIENLGNMMLEDIIQLKPDFPVPKNRQPLYATLDLMIRIDKRTTQQIQAVFRWALYDDFWQPHMIKANPASYLRKDNRFDQLEMKMKGGSKGTSSVNITEKNRAYAMKIAEQLNSIQKQYQLNILPQHVEFISLTINMQPICINFTEKGFTEQFDNLLRNRGFNLK